MARSALIASLRDQAARDLQAVGDEARAEAERYRLGLTAGRELERGRLDREVAAEVRHLEERAAAETARAARASTAHAAVGLAERLLALAREELPTLCGTERTRVLGALADELPPREWRRVRVNPADAQWAKARYPDALVEEDTAICGGLDVADEDGRVIVSNTLETRLAVAWPELLPGLVREVTGQDRGDGHAA